MGIYTFRTETDADNERVPALLVAIDATLLSERIISEPSYPTYKMGVFTIESEHGLSELKRSIYDLVFSNDDDRFADMHRCFQTLNEGNEPDELWHIEDPVDKADLKQAYATGDKTKAKEILGRSRAKLELEMRGKVE